MGSGASGNRQHTMGSGGGKLNRTIGASRRTSTHSIRVQISSHKEVFLRPSQVLRENDEKDFKYVSQLWAAPSMKTRTEDACGISQTSTIMPELLAEHLQAADLGQYIPSVSRWMEKEGVLDFAKLDATEIQDLYEELRLSGKCRRLFDICLGLYLEVLVKSQACMN